MAPPSTGGVLLSPAAGRVRLPTRWNRHDPSGRHEPRSPADAFVPARIVVGALLSLTLAAPVREPDPGLAIS
ncbi:MAG: hypothetical protein M3354_08660 [Chloroflexota bacterium]|nr:hypothetical protein [Chloroflexota bacterium]